MDIINAVLAAVMPHLLEALAALLAILIGWAADTARRRWGLQIEQAHRDALHSAIMTGARVAVMRALPQAQAVDLAVGYAQASVPDAIRALQPGPGVLENMARSKLGVAQ